MMDIAAETIAMQLEARRAARNDPYMDHQDREQVEEDFERAMTNATIAWLEAL
jgi:hypothetical protein